MNARPTLSSKGITGDPGNVRQLLGFQPGYGMALSPEADGLRLITQALAKTSSAKAFIGCTGYQGPPLA